MQYGGEPKRVKLTRDVLDQKEGQLGYTVPNTQYGSLGGLDDCVAVEFDNGTKLDVFWYALTKID